MADKKEWDGEERRFSMTPDEHHDVCAENKTAMKEYICMKVKPIIQSIDTVSKSVEDVLAAMNQRFKVVWLILILLLGALVVNGGLNVSAQGEAIKANEEMAQVNARQDVEITHAKGDISEIKQDLKDFRNEQRTANNKILEALRER